MALRSSSSLVFQSRLEPLPPTHSCGLAKPCWLDQTLLLSFSDLTLLDLTWSWVLCRDDAHDLVLKLDEESTLVRFRHKISNHVARGTPLHRQFVLVDPIGDKIVSNVDVLRALAARSLAVLLQKNSTQVVLTDNVLADNLRLRGAYSRSATASWN